MASLLRLSAENFRSLRDVEVDLGRLNVLVGPQGAGKSNFLDLVQFLGDSVRTDLGPALEARGGYSRVRYRGQGSTGPVRIKVEAAVTQHSHSGARDEYELSFSMVRPKDQRRASYLRRNESFRFKRFGGAGRRITIRGGRVEVVDENQKGGQVSRDLTALRSDSLGLATLPRLAEKEGGRAVAQLASLFYDFRVFDVDVRAASLPSAEDLSVYLEADGSNLASFLHWLSEFDPDRFEELVEDACEIVPGLLAIEFEAVGGARSAVAVRLKERGLRGSTDLAEASFGTVRTLALLALVYDPDPPLLTVIEEIDHGLHPYAFDLLTDRLRRASRRTQLLLATHSPAFVNRLQASELIVCERHSTGETLIPAADPKDLRAVEQAAGDRMRLGEIWFSGAIGGVPDLVP